MDAACYHGMLRKINGIWANGSGKAVLTWAFILLRMWRSRLRSPRAAASVALPSLRRPSSNPVLPESPADDAGFTPGCIITSVDGQPVRDMIDWRWLTADDVITLGYIDTDGDSGEVELERYEGEEWGFEFSGVVFDGVKQCRNACIFCFMRQLPDDMRPSLTLRDDDFRLSFLSGTFVTFTNLSAEDEARIIEQHISPLRVSLHASNPEVRRRIIGRHAQHGIDVMDRLLPPASSSTPRSCSCPTRTTATRCARRSTGRMCARASWTSASCRWASPNTRRASRKLQRPGGRPRRHGYHRACSAARPAERGHLWAFAADEFYCNAYGDELLENLPPTEHYGDFGMFEDGVGIIRSFVDDWEAAEEAGLDAQAAQALQQAGMRVRYIAGMATPHFFRPLFSRGPLAGVVEPLFVENRFFGGNVDVTGLLCSCDIAEAIRAAEAEHPGWTYVVPKVIFNDDGVTLDDATLEDMGKAAGVPVSVVSCNATGFLPELVELARE